MIIIIYEEKEKGKVHKNAYKIDFFIKLFKIYKHTDEYFMAQQSNVLRFHCLINGGRGSDYEAMAKMIDEDATLINSRFSAFWTIAQSQTALVQAIFARNHALVSFLLEMGADVNLPSKPDSYEASCLPLHAAIERDDLVMVQSLLAYGADPNLSIYSRTDVDGKSAREYAEYCMLPHLSAFF